MKMNVFLCFWQSMISGENGSFHTELLHLRIKHKCHTTFCCWVSVCNASLHMPLWRGSVHVHMCAHMWRRKSRMNCLFWLWFISCFLTGSHTDPGTHWLARLADQWVLGSSGLHPSLCPRVQTGMNMIGFSYMCQGPSGALFSCLDRRHFPELSLLPSLSFLLWTRCRILSH